MGNTVKGTKLIFLISSLMHRTIPHETDTISYDSLTHGLQTMYSQRNEFGFGVLFLHSAPPSVLASPVVEPKLYAWSCSERPSAIQGGLRRGRRLTPRRHDETPLFATRSDTVELLDIRIV